MNNKRAFEDLAVVKGSPAFSQALHVGRPNIGDQASLFARLQDMFDRRWLTNNGPFVKEFEQKIEEMVGVKHCVAVCNATVGLEIAVRALGLQGEVIVPSFTFIATAHALRWQGITPVFCDVDPQKHNIDPAKIESLITPRTTGIMGVHLWGRPCDIDSLAQIAAEHQIKLLFDAAHAFDCSYKGQMIGNFGDAEVFSFHATKYLNTFEGGVIVTNDDEVAAKARAMRNFGYNKQDQIVYPGTNGKMSEISAAMGLTGLESIKDFVSVNRRNYLAYQQELHDIPGVQLIDYDDSEAHNYQYIVLEIKEEITKISRDTLMAVLCAENILARRYFYPGCHRSEPYLSEQPNAGAMLPVTERLADRILVLPNGTAVSPGEITIICQIIRLAVKEADNIRQLSGGHSLI